MENIIEAEVTGIKQETHNVKSITLKTDVALNYLASHFVMVNIPSLKEEKEIWRAFSIASSPTENHIMLTMKLHEEGKFTPYIFNELTIGEKFLLKGPYGRFIFKKEEEIENIVLIAAGAGVAPMRSIMKYVYDKKLPVDVTLIYTSRYKEDIIYSKELDMLSEEKNFNIHITLTHPPDNWEGNSGRIGKDEIQKIIDIKEKTVFYICGPADMVKETRSFLKELGADKIIVEAW